MGNTSDNKDNKTTARQRMRNLNIGLLAHVEAGKTTLSEGMLFLSGSIRNLGRVDHGDAFLDTYEMERERGITIFSKQAVMKWKDMELTLLDTPGHVDFSAEMERVLQVLDYAVLLISGADGVQGHTVTLWRLLKRYSVPVFLFVNKMDREGTDRDALMTELKSRLDEGCTDFELISDGVPDALESLAVCDEEMLEEYIIQQIKSSGRYGISLGSLGNRIRLKFLRLRNHARHRFAAGFDQQFRIAFQFAADKILE